MDNYEARVKLIGETLVSGSPHWEMAPANIKTYVWSLSDLPLAALEIAIQKTIDTHKFSTLPTVAEIRENASAVATEGKDGAHPASCICWGSGFIQTKVDGYNEARPCTEIVEPDAVDNW